MKTIKSILLIAAIAFSSVISAHTNPIDAKSVVEPNVITTEVGKLLKNPGFVVNHDIKANVSLTINKNNEIVVLSVDSDDNSVEDFIKARLNYKALPVSFLGKEKTFIVPVRLHAELD